MTNWAKLKFKCKYKTQTQYKQHTSSSSSFQCSCYIYKSWCYFLYGRPSHAAKLFKTFSFFLSFFLSFSLSLSFFFYRFNFSFNTLILLRFILFFESIANNVLMKPVQCHYFKIDSLICYHNFLCTWVVRWVCSGIPYLSANVQTL